MTGQTLLNKQQGNEALDAVLELTLAGWWQTCCSNLEPQVWESLHASMEGQGESLHCIHPLPHFFFRSLTSSHCQLLHLCVTHY